MIKFGTVSDPWWSDQPVYIIGGGLSFKDRDISNLSGTLLGVNKSAFLVDVCNVVFSFDINFIHKARELLRDFSGEVFLCVPDDFKRDQIPGATYLRRRDGIGFSQDPAIIINGLNSGYGALNLALLKGAREIYLLGFDLNDTGNDPSHWHKGYSWNTGSSVKYYTRWADRFSSIAEMLPEGVRVYNANPESAITCFPIKRYEELGLSIQSKQ